MSENHTYQELLVSDDRRQTEATTREQTGEYGTSV